MKTKDIFNKSSFTVYPETTSMEVITLFDKNNLVSLLIVTKEIEIISMLTYSDLLRLPDSKTEYGFSNEKGYEISIGFDLSEKYHYNYEYLSYYNTYTSIMFGL